MLRVLRRISTVAAKGNRRCAWRNEPWVKAYLNPSFRLADDDEQVVDAAALTHLLNDADLRKVAGLSPLNPRSPRSVAANRILFWARSSRLN